MGLIDSALESNINNLDESEMFRAKIAVCGLGGCGSNTVQRLSRIGVKGANLIAVNTDSKHINTLDTSIRKMLIGGPLTNGFGAGGFPEMGSKAAEFSKTDLQRELSDYNLVFITAGMGGGTGTGAAPIAAQIAKENGAIVIGIVTFPFRLEGVRIQTAAKGLEALGKNVDTLIVVDNQRLVEMYPNLSIEQAFRLADEVAARAVRGITETVNVPSFINLDFADVRNVMRGGGLAMISIGEGAGENKVDEAIKDVLKNKILEVDYHEANSILIHITGGEDLTLGEANEIGSKLTDMTSPKANVVWGARVDPAYNGKLEIIAIFAGVKGPSIFGATEEKPENTGYYGLEPV